MREDVPIDKNKKKEEVEAVKELQLFLSISLKKNYFSANYYYICTRILIAGEN